MVDVLSWLQSDHGYYEESDMFSSEASSPLGSDAGEHIREESPFLPTLGGEGNDFLFSLLGEGSEAARVGELSSAYQPGVSGVGGGDFTSWPMPSQPLPGKFLPFSPAPSPQEDLPVEESALPVAESQHKPATSTESVSGTSIQPASSKNPAFGAVIDRSRKNAESARLNRQKKKQYVQSIEQELESLRSENKKLKAKCATFDTSFRRLVQEVEYLNSVIRNQSTLSTLLQKIPHAGGVQLRSSLPPAKRPCPLENGRHTECIDSQQQQQQKQQQQRQQQQQKRDGCPKAASSAGSKYSGGVCLHVASDNVCIEFCSHCSKNAAASTTD